MILFKKPKIYLDCFTTITELPILFPILNAGDSIPNFWKNLAPSFMQNNVEASTMKRCPGVSELYKQGLIIQNWADISIDTTKNSLIWSPEILANPHSAHQWGNSAFKDYYHLKLNNPWLFREKTGVKFLMTNTFWHDNSHRYVVPNGIVEWKYQPSANINIFIPKTSTYPKVFSIPAGRELVQLVPLSEKKLEVKMHVVDDKEFNTKLQPMRFTDYNWYYRRKKILQDKEQSLK